MKLPLPSPTLAARPRKAEVVAPLPPGISAKEVQAWVSAPHRALEERNVEALVALGALPRDGANRARQILATYEDFRVAFQEVEIQIAGSQAEVSFSRIDTIDGQTVTHPARKVFILEKGGNGQLSVHPP